MSEFLTFFSGTIRLRRRSVETVRTLTEDRQVRILPQSRASVRLGFDLYTARPDKGYSLTDCVSMQARRDEGLTDVLTNDRHFEQEGFRPLFRHYG